MAASVQDASDVLREVQKLAKELAPVRNALAALHKREAANANAAAAAASLGKIAARMDNVLATYRPILEAADDLTTTDLPTFLDQASLLLADDHIIEGHVKSARHAREQATSRSAENRRAKEKDAATASAFDDVCPPGVPCLLQPEDYRLYRQRLELRVDMVHYLLATGRKAFARHVADSYRLPLMWFPELYNDYLLELHAPRETSQARALTDTILLSASSTPCTNHAGRSSFSTPAKPPISPMLLAGRASTESSPLFATPSCHQVTAQARTTAVMTPPAVPVSRRTLRGHGRSPATAGADGRLGASVGAADPTVVQRDASSNLLLRVLASAVYMKDEYFDRMVVERLLAEPEMVAVGVEADGSHAAQAHSVGASAARTEAERAGVTRRLHSVEMEASVSSDSVSPASWSPPAPRSPASPASGQLRGEHARARRAAAGRSPRVDDATHDNPQPSTRSATVSATSAGARLPSSAQPAPLDPGNRVQRTVAAAWTPTSVFHTASGRQPAPAARGSSTQQARGEGSLWKPLLRARARTLPCSTINTQSGLPTFDASMMGVVEELLSNALPRPQAPGHCLPQPCSRLRPEALLLGDEAFTHERLAIRRAARLFEGHTGIVSGGDPADEARHGGVNIVPCNTEWTAAHAHVTPEVNHGLVATPNGSVWTEGGIEPQSVLRASGPADVLDDREAERDDGDPSSRATMRLQGIMGVPSAHGNVVYGVGTLRRIFLS